MPATRAASISESASSPLSPFGSCGFHHLTPIRGNPACFSGLPRLRLAMTNNLFQFANAL
jgi:hypothetical protein